MDKLIIVQEKFTPACFLRWNLPDEDDCIGDGYRRTLKHEPPSNHSNWEHWCATKIALESPPDFFMADKFVWETRRQAAIVLRSIKLAFKRGKIDPMWAPEAIKLGWTPPK